MPAAFASRLAQERDTPSCRATAAILMPARTVCRATVATVTPLEHRTFNAVVDVPYLKQPDSSTIFGFAATALVYQHESDAPAVEHFSMPISWLSPEQRRSSDLPCGFIMQTEVKVLSLPFRIVRATPPYAVVPPGPLTVTALVMPSPVISPCCMTHPHQFGHKMFCRR